MAFLFPTFHSHGCFCIFLLIFAPQCLSLKVLNVHSLLPSHACTSPKDLDIEGVQQKPRLTVVHRHGACSPLKSSHQPPPSHAQLLADDQHRVDSIHDHISSTRTSKHNNHHHNNNNSNVGTGKQTRIPATYGAPFGTGNYIVPIGIGSPSESVHVIFDTGSDVTWIQCKPCVSECYPQEDTLFDPAQSSTYANISCASPYCGELNARGCSASCCLYAVQYGDNSYTVGFYAHDTLSLTPSDTVQDFRFGCGEKNRGLFGETAGLLGLGRGKPSFVSQTWDTYGGVFSYCLPQTSSSTGYLTFGTSVSPTASPKYTPMLSDASTPTFYYLDMVGISVGGEQLSISPAVFTTAGTLIDSGTVISRMPPDAYSALRSAFRKAMSAHKAVAAYSILDTCYDFTAVESVEIPDVGIQFAGGTTLDVDVSGIMYGVSTSQVCLAFAANEDPADTAIVGNMQQRTYNVVYDGARKVIGFSPGGC